MKHLKILLLEDSPYDVMLIERELQKAGVDFTINVVCEAPAFEEALSAFAPDVILCDHHLPRMNSIEAFQLFRAHQKNMTRFIPFILVTGEASEEFAVHCIKVGIDDYILKDRLKRLPLSIENALEKCRIESERREYLGQVIRNEAMMREAEHLAQLGSWQIDLAAGRHVWSDEMFRVMGYQPGEITPGFDTFYSVVHPDDVERMKEEYARAVSSLSSSAAEFRILDKHGNLKHISGKIHIERDADNNPVRIAGFIVDITERKNVEVALHKREQEYRSLFDQHPDAVFSIDRERRLINANQRVADLLGHTLDDLLMKDFQPWVHPEDLDRTMHHFAAAFERRPQRFVTRVVGRDGKTFILDVANMPIVVNGEVIGVHGIARDITAEKELEDQLERAYRHARIGGWEVNLQNHKVSWSRMIREILEVEAEADIDLSTAFNFYKEGPDRQSIIDAVDHAMGCGRSWDVVVRVVTVGGKERWVRVMGEAEMRDGKCVRLRGTFQDVHDRKVAEETLRRTLHEKDNIAEQMRDGFFVVDPAWKVTYWNNIAERVMGRRRDDILGRNIWECFPETRSLPFYTESCRAMRDRQAVQFEALYPPLNLWLDVNIYPTDSGLTVYFKKCAH